MIRVYRSSTGDYSCFNHGKKYWNDQLGYCTKCYEIAMANPVVGCTKHDPSNWVESYPTGSGHCKACISEKYAKAPVCPHCGIKRGFAMGTGDCGCEVDLQ